MLPTLGHAYLLQKIARQLDPKLIALISLDLDIGEDGLTPNLCVYPQSILDQFESMDDMLDAPPKFDKMPVLAIEILSSSQDLADLIDKANRFLIAKIPTVWIVEPFKQVVIVITSEGRKQVRNGTAQAGEISLDFQPIFNHGNFDHSKLHNIT